jgi:hypothetical protein
MGMAGNDDVDTERDRIDPQGLEVVNDEDGSASEMYEFGFAIFTNPVATIRVSSDRGHRRDPAKGGNDIGTSDIAAMNDVIHASEMIFRFGPQQPVRIRNDSDSERHSSLRAVGCALSYASS